MAAACPNCGWQLTGAATCPRCGVDTEHYRGRLRAAMPASRAPAPAVALAPPHRPAGFWIRFAAFAIDGMVLLAAQTVLDIAAWVVFTDASPALIGATTRAFGAVMASAYTVILHWLRGQTLGKMAVSIRVVTIDGESLSLGRSVLRQLASFLSGLLLGIGYLMVAFRGDRRALHDLIAGTRVDRVP